ncbi:GRP family sugar transporter [Companilactobacillus halodurans]|uniref:Glucose transporter GlcU n=1 Tax=Companilactobacillus halodurans TaxID=2584183 RepID=A0A5P0ZS47_9LACO|nr:GRP family sugar transporter [Companilactobacillus halodurans]MQS77090.1 glucose transporter GlcU [Companilactobacillus halodurans]MQS98370.1 glucose transporter GlcU [Companilactobacillus halodurans]
MGAILLSLVPAIGWGAQALVMQKVGGKFTNKVMGMVLGTIIFSLLVLIFRRPNNISKNLIIGSLLCGIFWCFGQMLQVKSFDLVGVTITMPVSTGEQLLGTTLVSAIYFKEWTTNWQFILGISAILVIILGVIVISMKKNSNYDKANVKKSFILLFFSTIGMMGYAIIPRLFNLNGWDMLFPQAVSMVVTMFILVITQKDNQAFSKKTFENIPTGLCFAVANLALLLSNEINGVAVGFTMSQLNVVVSTLGGMIFLHEKKTHSEKIKIVIGLSLIIIGAVMIGITKN